MVRHSPLSLLQLLRFASTRDQLCLVFGALVAAVAGFSWNLLTVAFGDAVDVFVRFEHSAKNSSAAESAQFVRDVQFYASSLVVLWVVNTCLNFLLLVLFPLAAQNQIRAVKIRYFGALLRQDPLFFDQEAGGGDFASRVSADLKRVEDGLGEKLGLAIYHVSTAVIAVGTALLYGWQLTLVILSLLPFLAFGTSVMNKVQATMARKEADAYSAAGLIAQETIGAVRTVFAFGQQSREVARYSACLEPSLRSGVKRNFLTGLGNGLMFGCLYGGLALGVHFGVQMLLRPDSHYSLGTIVIVFWCVSGAGFSIGGAAPHFEAVRVAMATAARLWQVIDRQPKIDSSAERGLRPEVVRAEVEFRNVHFRYPTRPEVPVLEGFSLRVCAGESVALVGASGCGKSTVVQLLQRFYDPLEGAVLVDGHDVRDWNVEHLRRQMASVSQEPQLFDASLFDNIALGSFNKLVTQTDVEAAAKEANAHDFVRALPDQYETRVGERGAQLSGGQKQRVAIARALIKEPKILLLDEATSALDLESEAVVQQALERAARGRTTLIVAHRLSTIVNCSRIVFIKDGRVLEEGTHAQLMASKGLYSALVRRQQMSETSEGSEPEADAQPFPEAEEQEESAEEEMEMRDEEQREQSIIRHKFSSGRLWRMLLLDKAFLFGGLFLSLLYGLVVPVYAFVFGQFVEVFATATSTQEIRDRSHVFALYYVCIAVCVALISVSQMTLLGVAGERLTLRLRRLAFEAIMRQEISWFDKQENACGALCARLSSDAANVQGASGARMAIILQALSTFLASAVLGFALNWQLSLVASLFTPLILIGSSVSASFEAFELKAAKGDQEGAAKIALEALGNIRTVQSLQKEKTFGEKFAALVLNGRKAAAKKAVLRALTLSLCLSVVFLAYAVVFLYGGYLARAGLLRSGDFFIIIETLIYGSMTVGQSSVFTSDYRKAKLAAANIFRLIDRTPRGHAGTLRLETLRGQIGFRDVRFQYPSRRTPVLNGLTLEVGAGQTVALVGASGCGKSTAVQLLQKFYEVQSGHLTVDGQELSSLDTEWLRRQMALVSQEPSLFSLTIRENIEYGAATQPVPFADVVRAAQMANIHGFVSELPQGYETRVGAKGAQLSGGQRQRLAIARALVRNPRVLLLDEATSALDSESEKLVQMALDEACLGRTCLVIAHRLSTVRHAHKIAVVRRGRVVEVGSHEELLARKGVYHDLHALQFQ